MLSSELTADDCMGTKYGARNGAEFEAHLARGCSPENTDRRLQELNRLGERLVQQLRVIRPDIRRWTDLSGLGVGSAEEVRVLGSHLATEESYVFRQGLILAIGRSPQGCGVFPVLRDHFWSLDRDTDTQESSERFMCWSANLEHSTADDIEDLLNAARATEHGHHRGMAIQALGRFPTKREVTRGTIVALLDEPAVVAHAVHAAGALRLSEAREPLAELLRAADDRWLKNRITGALKRIDKQPL